MPDPLASRLGREEGKGEERRGGEGQWNEDRGSVVLMRALT